jgi:hypothetical protein
MAETKWRDVAESLVIADSEHIAPIWRALDVREGRMEFRLFVDALLEEAAGEASDAID